MVIKQGIADVSILIGCQHNAMGARPNRLHFKDSIQQKEGGLD